MEEVQEQGEELAAVIDSAADTSQAQVNENQTIGTVRAALDALNDILEIFSPSRVDLNTKTHGFRPGISLDLRNGWNFSRAKKTDVKPRG